MGLTAEPEQPRRRGGRPSRAINDPARPRILFYCQSSLGIGHVMRSLRLVEGMLARFDVWLVLGGSAVPSLEYPERVDIIQLPPLVSDAEFEHLQTETPGLSLEQTLVWRTERMLQAYSWIKPHIVMIEMYPFGRRRFAQELAPLIKLARQCGSRVICSVRDILVPKRDPQRHEARAVAIANRFFDAILVHGDPAFYRLDETFSRVCDMRIPLVYTGYVAPARAPQNQSTREPTIIASLGGGRFGHELAQAVVAAAPLLATRIPHRIELYAGPFCPVAVAAPWIEAGKRLQNLNVTMFRNNFAARLCSADLVISLGGYNTTMDVLAAGARALMYSCTNNSGMDQVMRLSRLAARGIVSLLHAGDLTPERLTSRIEIALRTTSTPTVLDLQGVQTTARILDAMWAQPMSSAVP